MDAAGSIAKRMRSEFTLPSFAKINWVLRIHGKRNDGFHELCTLFQTVSLHDTVSFSRSDDLVLSCDDRRMPTDARNLIIKAAKLLRERCGLKTGASIHLKKRIPSPGGLGGGSSNAAVTLLGMIRLWRLDVADDDLQEMASSLGSDVPFFLYGGTAVGTGRGEVIEPIGDIAAENMLLVTPNVRVSTREAFAAMDTPTLTISSAESILTVCRKEAESLDPYHSTLENDFEASVFSSYPEVKRVKDTLLDLGAINAAMSGSGASVFAIFDKTETRQTAEKALDKESTWRKFAVSTVSRDKYRELLHPSGA